MNLTFSLPGNSGPQDIRLRLRESNHAGRVRSYQLLLHTALLLGITLVIKSTCYGQGPSPVAPTSDPASKSQPDKPLTSSERDELLKIIRNLQERVDKLEAAQASVKGAAPEPSTQPTAQVAQQTTTQSDQGEKPDPSTSDDPHVWMEPVVKEKPKSEAKDTASYGRYTPNLG